MIQTAVTETTESYRFDAALKLDPKNRALLGQYMTPAPIGHFMASLFSDLVGDLKLLDAGAGVGSLTAAFAEILCEREEKPHSVSFTCYEIEPMLIDYLSRTLQESELRCAAAKISASSEIREEDFISSHSTGNQGEIFQGEHRQADDFTHVIMNPPYKKINSGSEHRFALRRAGIPSSCKKIQRKCVSVSNSRSKSTLALISGMHPG